MSGRRTDIEMAQSLLKEMGHESLRSYFDKRLRTGKGLKSRPVLLTALARLTGKDSKELLVSIAHDPVESPETRTAAAKALGYLAKQSTETSERLHLTQLLMRLLENENIEIRSAAAMQLSELRAQEAIEVLRKSLREDKFSILASDEVQKFLGSVITPGVNLPVPIHSFIGRERDLQELHDAFNRSQIVTLTGMGGIGKTSLAAKFARESNYDVKVWRSCQYSLDPADLANDLVLQLAEQLHPHQTSLKERFIDPSFDWRRIESRFRQLLMDYSALIVLDDYEETREEHKFGTFLENVVVKLPRIHCLIVGRVIPRMLKATVIRLSGLSLTESHVFIQTAATQRNILLNSEIVQRIAKLADGNTLLLNLYVSAVSQGLSIDEVRTDREEVISSIISRSIQKLTQSQRRALEILSQFNEPISVSDDDINGLFKQEGTGAPSEWLVALSELSLVNVDSQGSIALHDLIRQLISSRTDKRTILRVNGALGEFYKKRDNLLRSATHFIRADMPEQAILMLHESRVDIVNEGHSVSALEVLNSISSTSELEATIRMKFFSCMGFYSQFHGEHEHAIESYQKVLEIARQIGDRKQESKALGNLGRAYADVGETQQAIQYYEQRLAIAREIGDHKEEGIALGNLGRAYGNIGEPEQAIQYYERRLALAREVGDRTGESGALGNLGRIYMDTGDPFRAIDCYQQRLAIAREIGDRRREGVALGTLGQAYAGIGEIWQAINFYDQRLAIAQEFGDRRGEANALGRLGRSYADLGEIAQAIERHTQRLTISREIGDPRGESGALDDLADAYVGVGEKQRAIQHYEQALQIMHKIGDRRGEANTLSKLGAAYSGSEDHSRAIEYYEQALQIMHKIGDRRGEANTLSKLGAAYAGLEDHSRAREYYGQALQIMHKIRDPRGEANTLTKLGATYAVLEDHRQAREYYEQALQIMHKIRDPRGEANTLTKLGAAYVGSEDHRRAIEYYEQALQIMHKIGDRRGESNSLGNLGVTHSALGENIRAAELFRQQLAIAREIGDRSHEGKALWNLSLVAERQKERNKAIAYAEEALSILQQIDHSDAVRVRKQLADWGA